MAIDFAAFTNVVPFAINAGLPVLLRGQHGIGKSELVYQIARDMALPVVERRASQMTEGDLMGLPSILVGKMDVLPDWLLQAARKAGVNVRSFVESMSDSDRGVLGLPPRAAGSTAWNAPDWLKRACDEAVILFLDEVDRAEQQVRQGIFELTDSRKLNGWSLHPGTRIFAACNGGTHAGASSYQVADFDPAELDRWCAFDVQPSVSDWLTWAREKVHPMVWNFVNANHTHLEHDPGEGGYEPNKKYPSRRSWKRLNDVLVRGCLLNDNSSLGTVFHLATSIVGFEAAVSFKDFVEQYDRQVSVEDILDHGQLDKLAAFTINDHLALVEKLDASDRLKTEMSDDSIQNLANWFVTIPSEVAMKLFALVGNSNDNNIVRLHRTTANNGQTVMSYVASMLSIG